MSRIPSHDNPIETKILAMWHSFRFLCLFLFFYFFFLWFIPSICFDSVRFVAYFVFDNIPFYSKSTFKIPCLMPEIIYDTIYNIQLDLGPKSILLEIIT